MRWSTCICIMCVVCALVAVTFKAPSEKKTFVIAVINGPRIKKEAKLFVNLNNFWEKEHKKSHDSILKEEIVLRDEYEKIRLSLEPSMILKKKKHIFDQKMLALQKKVQSLQVNLRQHLSKRARSIEEKMNIIIRRLVQEKGIQLVLNTQLGDKRVVLYSESHFDITNDVIKKLDELPLEGING